MLLIIVNIHIFQKNNNNFLFKKIKKIDINNERIKTKKHSYIKFYYYYFIKNK